MRSRVLPKTVGGWSSFDGGHLYPSDLRRGGDAMDVILGIVSILAFGLECFSIGYTLGSKKR